MSENLNPKECHTDHVKVRHMTHIQDMVRLLSATAQCFMDVMHTQWGARHQLVSVASGPQE